MAMTVIMTAIMSTVTVIMMKKAIMVMTMDSKSVKEESCRTEFLVAVEGK